LNTMVMLRVVGSCSHRVGTAGPLLTQTLSVVPWRWGILVFSLKWFRMLNMGHCWFAMVDTPSTARMVPSLLNPTLKRYLPLSMDSP